MTITAYSLNRWETLTTVTVTSDLSGTIYYYWYIDGAYVGVTTGPTRTFVLEDGDQVRVQCNDSNSASYDAVANAPDGYPARRTLFWTRPPEADVAQYHVEQNKDAAGWTTLGYVTQDDRTWAHKFMTGRLTDLSSYQWRVTPMDAAGNEGTAITLASEKVVRTPDAPEYTATFDDGTTKVTFAEA